MINISQDTWNKSFNKYYKLCISFVINYRKKKSYIIYNSPCFYCETVRTKGPHGNYCANCPLEPEIGNCATPGSTWWNLDDCFSENRLNKKNALNLSQQILKAIWKDGLRLGYTRGLNAKYNKAMETYED